jgi:hypothetical protein
VAVWLKAPKRLLAVAVAGALAAALVAGVSAPTRGAPPAPDSPAIAFDHVIHAGQYGIACLGCHVYADRSSSAGVPSVRKCMGCHKFVAKDKPNIQALATMFEQGQGPRWPRVTRVPDFIYFSHRMHVRSDVACSECHGDVKAMHTVVPVRELTMGFCLGCHDQRKASVDCLTCHK